MGFIDERRALLISGYSPALGIVPEQDFFLLPKKAGDARSWQLDLLATGGSAWRSHRHSRSMGSLLWREYVETVGGAVSLAVFIMVFHRAVLYRRRTFDAAHVAFGRAPSHGQTHLPFPGSPTRRDVVFRYPADPSHHFIKRVIGVPATASISAGHRLCQRRRAGGELHQFADLGGLPRGSCPPITSSS